MSSEEITSCFTEILKQEWESEEKELFQRLMDSFLYSRRFITKAMKEDFLKFLQVFEKVKKDLNEKKLLL